MRKGQTLKGNDVSSEKFTIVNISDCMEGKVEGFAEPDLKRAIAVFSSIDLHVQSFLQNNAEEFARQHKSVTYLVFSSDMLELLGYFTLAIKPITVHYKMVSRTTERAFKKTGNFDEEQNTYTVAAYLIAQLGRNFAPSLKNTITGKELLQLALYRLKLIQRDVGGTVVFLEAQDNGKVLSFYASNGFKELGRRMPSSKDYAALELVRLVKVL